LWPAIFLLDGDPVEPELAHLRPQVAREFVLLVDLGGDRFDLVFGKPPRGLADRVGHFAEAEIESGVGHVRVSCSPEPLAERNHELHAAAAFEQAQRGDYVRCNKSSPERGGGPCEAWWWGRSRGIDPTVSASRCHLPVPGRI
jgi:hypothetical protein